MTAFSKLARHSLESLAEAFESGRIESGNPLLLQQYVPADCCAEVSVEIDDLIRGGFEGRHIARLIRAVIHERWTSKESSPIVSLVWTGPDGSGGASRDTGVVVRELFMSAKHSILVAGFAVHRGREIFKELAERVSDEPDLDVRMFLNISRAPGDTTLTQQLVARFVHQFRTNHWSGTRNPAIYYDPRALTMAAARRTVLHAKCVVIDRATALVTSANFTEAAQERNIEAGALVTDSTFAGALVDQFDGLVHSGAVERLPLG